MTVIRAMARRLTAAFPLVILVLRHDMVMGQGGEEAQIQRQNGKLDMGAWLKSNGGQMGWMMGTNSQGIRGALATHSYQPGDIISIVPRNCTFDLGPQEWTAPELAVNLMGSRFAHPAKWKFVAPYIQTLPDSYSLYGKYTFIQEHVALLQDDKLADMVYRMRQWLEWVFTGESEAVAGERTVPALIKAFPDAAQLTFSDLSYWTALVDMYSFSFEHPVSKVFHRFLVPALDMVNHEFDANAEVRITRDGEYFAARALKHIKPGEEVTHRYSWSIERNDKALMNYFFVHQRSPPRLCAADLPGGSVWDDQERSPPEDDVGSPGGVPVSKEESKRLEAILGTFPTTEDEDRDALANGDVTDWRARTVIGFRVRRKEALRLAVERIGAALGTGQAAEVSTDGGTGRATTQDGAGTSAQSPPTRMTSGVKYDGQVPDDIAAGETADSAEPNSVAAGSDSLETSQEDSGSGKGTQNVEQVSGAGKRAVVKPVEGASEDLQKPKFIKIGSPAVDEL